MAKLRLETQCSSRLRRRGFAVALATLATALLSAPPGSGALSVARQHASESAAGTWMSRHGSHEDENEEIHGILGTHEAQISPDMHSGAVSSAMDSEDSQKHVGTHHSTGGVDAAHTQATQDEAEHSNMSHQHSYTSAAIDLVPAAETAGPWLIEIPELPHITGHAHAHGHGGPIQLALNETTLFRSHGPDPLSYMEWDFSWGLGRTAELRRFTNGRMRAHDNISSVAHLMGVSGDRWRTLVDVDDFAKRQAIEQDIHDRLAEGGQAPSKHKTLLVLHVATSILSCIFLLPTLLVLRAANSGLASLFSLLYMGTLSGSIFLSFLYRTLTPRLYPSNAHSGLGWAIFWISCIVFGADLVRSIPHAVAAFARASGSMAQRAGAICRAGLTGKARREHVYSAMEQQELPERMPSEGMPRPSLQSHHHVHFADLRDEEVGLGHRQNSSSSYGSGSGSGNGMASPTSTLCDTPRQMSFSEPTAHIRENSIGHALPFLPWKLQPHQPTAPAQSIAESITPHSLISPKKPRWRTVLRYAHVTVARGLTLVAFAAVYTGIAVYTGSCRGAYKNTCLAHGIKGGIFFAYGLLTFGRYLGAYSELGWAWNKRPNASNSRGSSALSWQRNAVSAEWVESFVCFFYGATNMWMERFGAEAGDPFTIKQIQHIGIAVMFCFCGLVGIILETRWIRDLLARHAAQAHPSARRLRASSEEAHTTDGGDGMVAAQSQPPSYDGSFNPFPALVIGVTGLAMAAHAQNIEYERVIHVLWGNLLAGFSVMRCLTYFFLWLRPPVSVLPSRPPTEALGSFSLACGGLVFMLSSEQVSQWALRAGYADAMAVANVSIALIALLFAWTAILLLIKAAAMRREDRMASRSGSLRPVKSSEVRTGAWKHATEPSEPVFVLEDGEETVEMDAGQNQRYPPAAETPLRDFTRSPDRMDA